MDNKTDLAEETINAKLENSQTYIYLRNTITSPYMSMIIPHCKYSHVFFMLKFFPGKP